MHNFWIRTLTVVFIVSNSLAQKPQKPTSTEIHHSIKKLNFLGTALYVAAHPDDENTRLISYLSNHDKARTAYLSLTRGDGGQNLIGAELRELLGVLRTQELQAARRVDGGEQWFTRANDFGYSKHPNETLKIWDKEKVLGDVVWAIRNLKPDIIINRFDHRTPGSTHGHHTTSAMLSVEAYDLANDPKAYPEQLEHAGVWQPKRTFFNTSWWFYGSRENFEKADKSNLVKLDVGVYYPELGLSNNEIASIASSQHLCQGFGRLTTRGSQDEYVELLKGSLPSGPNLFEGIDTSWSRIEGGKAIGDILYAIENDFDFENPSKHVPDLVKAYQLLQQTRDEHWKTLKSEELKSIILACAGLYLEVSAESSSTTPGNTSKLNIEVLNRSNLDVVLHTVQIDGTTNALSPELALAENKKENLTLDLDVSNSQSTSDPYWLKEPWSLGMYKVADQKMIGKAENPSAFSALFTLSFEGVSISFMKPVIRRFSKPDQGELYEPFEVLPEVTTEIVDKVLIFASPEAKNISVHVKAGKDGVSGSLELGHPEGWTILPESIPFSIEKKGEEQTLVFQVTPPVGDHEGYIKPKATINGNVYDKELVEIEYNHVPKQSILLPSKAKVVRMNIQKTGEHIGYIVGAGDKVPESLEQIGYQVHIVDPNSIQAGTLAKYDAVVVGIRAYNVVEQLKFKQPFLMEYVENGGNLIVQYNTAGRWRKQFENIAPYELTVSRDRVTDENADVRILAKDHSLVNFPNKIEEKDFEGWVQERGLYFPNQWAPEFTPILSMNDEGETPKDGALLVAPHGQGNYIYTGLSFFRELPEGVSGAFKLFANMLSVGKSEVKSESNIKG
ncbi:PIG-L family deacetylase [Flagellimonas allohymeniacidonis]|uniref:PIG-L family deacetylase n=1 Tax=Flagellimonas allohymeniacidonis TaxID=2517819 RepID=A0A4Q8QFY4_9FLAO|nr:PIG-L family deacetylase [Allomuricauda hymeniacidonis]TAI48627.1 PIG-L family deacetylase [Allomuricauda hymeniacidonis]